MELFILILKLVAGIVAALIATKIIVIKAKSGTAVGAEAGKWRLTTEGILGITALWVTLVFSTGVDILKYVQDQEKAEVNRQKELENERRSRELLQHEQDIKTLAKQANDGIEQANRQLQATTGTLTDVVQRQVDAANIANATLGSVNTANDRLRTSAGTLNHVVQRQVEATGTANQTLSRLIETSGVVRRSSKPLRPLGFVLHVKYEYGSTSDDFRKYVNSVRRTIDEIESNVNANREDVRRERDRGNWGYDATNIYIYGPSFLTSWDGARRVERILTSGTVGITIRPTEQPTTTVAANQVSLIGHASFMRNRSPRPTSDFRVIPRPSNLEIVIDRRSGDITQRFFVDAIDPIGAVFGINSLYDFPSKWLEVNFPVPVRVSDSPRITHFAYKNDTFITNGIFPENIILDYRRFNGPTDLSPSRSNREPGVAFVYHLQEDDLNSAARFENQRP